MPRSDWREKASFMREVGATHAEWDASGEDLTSLTLAPQPRPAAPAPQPGPAAKLAQTFAEKLRREHETRFAASHFKPRLDVPQTTDDVPRAVRAREASGGRSSSKQRRR